MHNARALNRLHAAFVQSVLTFTLTQGVQCKTSAYEYPGLIAVLNVITHDSIYLWLRIARG